MNLLRGSCRAGSYQGANNSNRGSKNPAGRRSKSGRKTNQPYYDVQAIVEGEGLVRYSTGAQLLVQELRSASLPMRDKVIQQDWRGLFFEGSVYTLEEEEERIRREFNINY